MYIDFEPSVSIPVRRVQNYRMRWRTWKRIQNILSMVFIGFTVALFMDKSLGMFPGSGRKIGNATHTGPSLLSLRTNMNTSKATLVPNTSKLIDNTEVYIYDVYQPKTEQEKQYYQIGRSKKNIFKIPALITNDKLCDNHPLMILAVKTRPEHYFAREVIRETWGGVAKAKQWPHKVIKDKVQLVFLIGTFDSDEVSRKIREESKLNGDIIQGNFEDTYYHLTEKSLFGMQWVANHCKDAKYYMQCDEDVFVNVPHILDTLHRWDQQSNLSRAIMGPHMGTPMVGRGRGKWAAKYEEFPFSRYPIFEAGTGYIITTDILSALVHAAQYLPYHHIDDVFITGIVGATVGLRHAKQAGFSQLSSGHLLACPILQGTILTWHNLHGDKLREFWQTLQTHSGVCP